MIKLKTIKLLSFLWMGSLASALFAFLTQVIMARGLGVGEFGSFSSALATVALFAPLAGFGVPALWLKVFGVEGWEGLRWIKPSFGFVFGSTLLVLLVIFLWGGLGAHESATKHLIFILSFYILGQVAIELVSSKFQLEERYLELAVWQLFPHVLRFVLIAVMFWLVSDYASLTLAGAIYSAVAVICLVLSAVPLLRMSRGNFLLRGHSGSHVLGSCGDLGWKEVACNAWPFGVGAFAHLIYFQSDIILIKYMVGNEAAGHYNVAFTVIAAIYLLPSVLYQKFLLPKMHRWAAHDKERFYLVYRKGNLAMLCFGLVAMTGVWLLGDGFIVLLFGSSYKETSGLLNILAVSAPLISVALSAGATLVTNENVREKVKYMLFVAVLNFLMNVVVIPIWGAEGAALTTVASNAVLLALYLYGAERKVFQKRFL